MTAADLMPAGALAVNTTRDLPAIERGQEMKAADGAVRRRRVDLGVGLRRDRAADDVVAVAVAPGRPWPWRSPVAVAVAVAWP